MIREFDTTVSCSSSVIVWEVCVCHFGRIFTSVCGLLFISKESTSSHEGKRANESANTGYIPPASIKTKSQFHDIRYSTHTQIIAHIQWQPFLGVHYYSGNSGKSWWFLAKGKNAKWWWWCRRRCRRQQWSIDDWPLSTMDHLSWNARSDGEHVVLPSNIIFYQYIESSRPNAGERKNSKKKRTETTTNVTHKYHAKRSYISALTQSN